VLKGVWVGDWTELPRGGRVGMILNEEYDKPEAAFVPGDTVVVTSPEDICCVAAFIECSMMNAENAQREFDGLAPLYGAEAYYDLLTKYGLTMPPI
jgi:hypothetical protein